jgi:hypothetical protein
MFKQDQLLAIRWVWYQDPEGYQGTRYIPAKEWLEMERDSSQESSCEVEYFAGQWWAGCTSFGLALDPTSSMRRVWASDVHTYCNDKGLLVADDRPCSAHTAIGWEGAYKKMPKWRKYEKTWWSEGTFPARPRVVAFAMTADADESVSVVWEAAKEAFGDLPVIIITGHPDAIGSDDSGKWVTFDPIYNRSLDVRLWHHAWYETNTKLMSYTGFVDDFGTLVETSVEITYS